MADQRHDLFFGWQWKHVMPDNPNWQDASSVIDTMLTMLGEAWCHTYHMKVIPQKHLPVVFKTQVAVTFTIPVSHYQPPTHVVREYSEQWQQTHEGMRWSLFTRHRRGYGILNSFSQEEVVSAIHNALLRW